MVTITVSDFYNKVLTELDGKYFPNVKYYRDNEKCAKLHYTVELFNNGVLTYATLVKRVSKLCGASTGEIEEILSKYLVITK
jgi:hypothetical protein